MYACAHLHVCVFVHVATFVFIGVIQIFISFWKDCSEDIITHWKEVLEKNSIQVVIGHNRNPCPVGGMWLLQFVNDSICLLMIPFILAGSADFLTHEFVFLLRNHLLHLNPNLLALAPF